MDITFYGEGCFALQDKKATVLTDPNFGDKAPAKLPKKVDIVTISNVSKAKNPKFSPETLVFDWPGEFESSSIYIEGITEKNSDPENCIFCYRFPEASICYLGTLSQKLNEETLEKIGNIDVLLVPVGLPNGLTAKKALEVIEQIDPRAVIPMYYQTDEKDSDLGELNPFLEVMGKKEVETLSSLNISKSSLSDDKTDLFVLSKTA